MDQMSSLSAIMTDISKSLTTAQQQLTSIPLHPYEATKKLFFEDGHQFPTINDINVPEDVTTEGLVDKISQIQKNYQDTLLDYISNPDEYVIEGAGGNYLSLLAEASGTNGFVVTKEKYKKYIEFLETIQTVDVNSITEENCNDIIQKLGYSLVDCLNCRTVKQ